MRQGRPQPLSNPFRPAARRCISSCSIQVFVCCLRVELARLLHLPASARCRGDRRAQQGSGRADEGRQQPTHCSHNPHSTLTRASCSACPVTIQPCARGIAAMSANGGTTAAAAQSAAVSSSPQPAAATPAAAAERATEAGAAAAAAKNGDSSLTPAPVLPDEAKQLDGRSGSNNKQRADRQGRSRGSGGASSIARTAFFCCSCFSFSSPALAFALCLFALQRLRWRCARLHMQSAIWSTCATQSTSE